MKNELDRLWSDPGHWKWGPSYYCPEDPRIIVPQRIKWFGYSVNYAHKSAYAILIGMLLALLTPFLAVIVFENPTGLIVSAVSFILIVVILTGLCHWESTRAR